MTSEMKTHKLGTRIAAALCIGALGVGGLSACGKDDAETVAEDQSPYGDSAPGDFTGEANPNADPESADGDADGELIVDTDGDGIADAPAGTPGTVVGAGGAGGNDAAGNDGGADGAAKSQRRDGKQRDQQRGQDNQRGDAQHSDAQRGQGGQGGQGGGQQGNPQQPAVPAPGNAGPQDKIVPEPVEGGQPGSEQDKKQIVDMLNGIYTQTTVNNLTRAIGDNTCNRVIEASGGRAAFNAQGGQDISFDELGMSTKDNGVIGFEQFTVKDNSASAMVKARTAQGEDQALMRFEREDGRWKMCA